MSAVLDTTTAPTTVKTYLRPIDREGLMAFAEKGRNNPASRGTNKVHTVTEGQYRTLSYVGNHAPVVVDEPLHLFGQPIERARTNSWQREPGQLYNGLLAMGCEATLEKVFEYMVEERHAYLTASPSERARIDQIKQMQKQQALMQQRAAELERQAKAA